MTERTADAIEKLLKIINIDEKIMKLYREIEFYQTRKENDAFLKWRIPNAISLRQKKVRELSQIRGNIKTSLNHDIFVIKKEAKDEKS